MFSAVEKVRDRLLRATATLEQAGIPYAVIGGNAVAAWVSEVDEAAVRNTQNVDILLARADLERAKVAMTAAGFVYRHSSGIDMFLDGPESKARDAVHVVFAGEKIPGSVLGSPRGDEINLKSRQRPYAHQRHAGGRLDRRWLAESAPRRTCRAFAADSRQPRRIVFPRLERCSAFELP
jgi:hypothetical protein